MHAAGRPDGSLIVAGYQQLSTKKQTSITQPVAWTRSGTTWSGPIAYDQSGVQGTGLGITAAGQMMGRRFPSGSSVAVWGVWDSPMNFSPLTTPFLQAMNDAATLVVGVATGGGPALWYRDGSGNWNPNPLLLPISSSTCGGSAQDVNNDGVIVGYSCDAATVWQVDASVSPPIVVFGPTKLIGLGGNGSSATSRADAVSSTYPYVVAGGATAGGGRRLLVKWLLP